MSERKSLVFSTKPVANPTEVATTAPLAGADVATSAPTKVEVVDTRVNTAPSNIATLIVAPDGDDYTIAGYHATEPLPRFKIGRVGYDSDDLKTVKGFQKFLVGLATVPQLDAASPHDETPFSALSDWILRLTQSAPDLTLIIFERTATGIPWEHLRVHKTFLGAAVATVRWLYVPSMRHKQIKIEDLPTERKGVLAACPTKAASTAGLNEAAAKKLTDHVAALAKLSGHAFESLPELRQHLQGEQPGTGLAYALCHGDWDDGGGGQLRPIVSGSGKPVTYFDLTLDDDDLHPVVFLNACESGIVPTRADYDPKHQLVGFVEPFLRRGSPGVIGTTRSVQLSFATDFAMSLLGKIRTNPKKVPLAVLLRELRHEVVEAYRANKTEAGLQAVFWACAYILWGSPSLHVELS